MSLGEAALGVLATLGLWGAVALGAALLSRRLEPHASRDERWLSLGLLGAALIAYPLLALGAAGILSLATVAVTLGVLVLGVLVPGALLDRRRARRLIAAAGQALPRDPQEEGSAEGAPALLGGTTPLRRSALATLWLAVAAVGGERLSAALRDPPLSWDSLGYHLALATEWLQTGALGPLYHPFAPHTGYFAGSGELFSLWALLPFGNDLLVGLPNFAFLGLGALALYRIARECGASPRAAAVLAPLYLLTPAVARVAATSYVEPALNAFLFTALAYVLAYLRTQRPQALFLSLLALGLAVGTKFTALAYTAVLLAPLAVLTGRALRRGTVSRRATWLALTCGVLCCALGGYWYARNVALGGNPVYPNEVKVAGLELFAGVPIHHGGVALDSGYRIANALVDAARQGTLVASVLGTQAPASHELGLGPKIVALTFFAFWALGWLVAQGRWRWRGGLATMAAVYLGFGCLVLATPVWQVDWLASNIRFAVPAMALGLVLLVVWLEARGTSPVALALLAAALALPDALVHVVALPESVRLGLALALLALVALLLWRGRGVGAGDSADAAASLPSPGAGQALPPRRPARPDSPRAPWRLARLAGAAVATFAALVFAAHALSNHREERRHDRYASAWDLHETLARYFASAWRWLDEHVPADARIAQSGFEYLYPLYGPRLSRRVRHVDVNARAGGAYHAYPLGTHRQDADPAAWLANLRSQRIGWLALARPWHSREFPLEAAWADARPDVFRLAFRSVATRVYEVRLEPPAAEASR